MVFDLDGDLKAEVVMKTADGTIDGEGSVIGTKKQTIATKMEEYWKVRNS
jgi:hypothetical protein